MAFCDSTVIWRTKRLSKPFDSLFVIHFCVVAVIPMFEPFRKLLGDFTASFFRTTVKQVSGEQSLTII